jgi:hypothetical protein
MEKLTDITLDAAITELVWTLQDVGITAAHAGMKMDELATAIKDANLELVDVVFKPVRPQWVLARVAGSRQMWFWVGPYGAGVR